MFKTTIKQTDPKMELPVSKETILDLCSGGTFYEDIYVSRKTFINLMIVGCNGVFTFSGVQDDKNLACMTKEIQKCFELGSGKLFCFFLTEDESFVSIPEGNILKIENFYESFENLYINLLRPEIDRRYLNMTTLSELMTQAEVPKEYLPDNGNNGKTYEHEGVIFEIEESYEREDDGDAEYVKPIITDTEEKRISHIASEMAGNTFPDATYKVDADGQEWVLKDESIKIKTLDTGIVGNRKWYRISDRDENKMLLLTAIGGCFGFHKIAVGNIVGFIGYLLTCGGAGMLPVLDTLQFMFGSAGYTEVDYEEDEDGQLIRNKERVYFKKIQNKALLTICVMLSALISFILVRYIYRPLIGSAFGLFASTAAGMDENATINQMNLIERIFSILSPE